MNTSVLVVMFMAISIPLAFAQTESEIEDTAKITITTDRASYKPYQIMTVTFQFYNDYTISCLKYDIIYPSGYSIPSSPCQCAPGETLDQEKGVCVVNDKPKELETKTIKIELDPFNFPESGQYTIRAHYDSVVSEAIFMLDISPPPPPKDTRVPNNNIAVYEGEHPDDHKLESEIQMLQTSSAEKDQRIVDLEAENQSLKDQIAALTKKIDDLTVIVMEQLNVMVQLLNGNSTS